MSGIITKPVFWVIMIAMWGLVFPLIAGAYNSINLNTVASGSSTSERYDRVIAKSTHVDAAAAWLAKTAVLPNSTTAAAAVANSAYMIGGTFGATCNIPITGATAGDEWYTPSGNVVKLSNPTGDISGCKWTDKSPIFGVFNAFVRVLMQVIALAGPLGFMLALAYFGSMLIGSATGHPVLRIVMVVVLVLVGAILVNIVLPYIAGVFNAIDGERFAVFDQELGLIAGLLRNFFGVIFVSGIIGSAWSIIGEMRGGGSAQGSFQGSGM